MLRKVNNSFTHLSINIMRYKQDLLAMILVLILISCWKEKQLL